MTYSLIQSLQCCMQYRIVLHHRFMMAPDCVWRGSLIRYDCMWIGTLMEKKIHRKTKCWVLWFRTAFYISNPYIQSSVVITRSNIVRYDINNYWNWDRISIRCWIFTKDIPQLALTGELWDVFCEDLWENWACYNGTEPYVLIYPPVNAMLVSIKILPMRVRSILNFGLYLMN